MTGRYQEYSEYKNSNDWLGKVPFDWCVSKFAYVKSVLTDFTANGSFADLKKNVTYKDEPDFARLVRLTDLRKDLNNDGVWIDENAYQYLSKSALFGGEFLLANVGAYAGLFYQMPYGKGAASLAPNMFMAKFQENRIFPKFMAYVGQSDPINKQLILSATASSAQPKLNKDNFKAISFAYPQIKEQQKIANFLDHETAKIDTLIAKQEKLIELLKEKRQAVISHAVTRGLNSKAPMKDSGVEWLGEVPEHWSVKKLKFCANLLSQKEKITTQTVIALENIEGGTGKYISSNSKYSGDDVLFNEGDILFGKLRPYLSKVFLCGTSGIAFGDILAFRPNNDTSSSFLFYTMISEWFIEIVNSSTYGSKMPRASSDFINEMEIAFPPIDEQKEIAENLDTTLEKFEILTKKSISAIELMKERKIALISAAVTGKIDVRNWNN